MSELASESSAQREPIEVLLVEDHPTFRFGLRMRLEAEPDIAVVGEAGSAEEAVALVETTAPDVAVVDLNLPGMDGVELIRQARRGRPARRDARPDHAQRRLGDRGRPRGGTRLPAQGRRARPDRRGRTGGGRGGVGVLRCGRGAAARGTGRAAAGPHVFPELTAREHEILELVAAGLTNAEIGRRLALRPKTVRNYVANVLAKIHAADRADAVLRARRAGLG